MSGTALYIDNFDLSTLGFATSEVEGWKAAPQQLPRLRPRWRRHGEFLVDTYVPWAPKTITVKGIVTGATAAAVQAAWDEIKYRCSKDTVQVRFVDEATRYWVCRLLGADVSGIKPQFVNPQLLVGLTFGAELPFAFQTTQNTPAFTTATAMPLGTAPSRPVLRITGAFTDPVITYKNSGATTIHTLGFTLTKAGGQWIDIDMDAGTVVDNASVDQIGAISSGTFPFALDPDDGDFPTSAWPTLAVSSGSGVATYRRCWL